MKDTAENLTLLVIFVATGAVFICISFMYLPWIIISPEKFSAFFSLGSLSILGGIGYYKGFTEFVKSNFTGKAKWYSVGYLASLLANLYFALIRKSFFFALILSGVQVFHPLRKINILHR
jgi:hypothetical protein